MDKAMRTGQPASDPRGETNQDDSFSALVSAVAKRCVLTEYELLASLDAATGVLTVRMALGEFSDLFRTGDRYDERLTEAAAILFPEEERRHTLWSISSSTVESELRRREVYLYSTTLVTPRGTSRKQWSFFYSDDTHTAIVIACRDEGMLGYTERDGVSGVYTRTAFLRSAQKQYAVVLLDIEHFKLYNDLFGATGGDSLLADIGRELHRTYEEGCVRQYGRFGADRFVIVYDGTREEIEETIRRRILWFHNYRADYDVRVHFGICAVDKAGTNDIAALCDRALLAMQTARADAQDFFAWYDESMRTAILEQQELERDIRLALDKREFEAWYQPQFDQTTGAMIGAEALARWRRRGKGLTPPDSFIPLMEKVGLIERLDLQILEKVCASIVEWRKRGLRIVPISVNLSRRDFYDTALCETICRICAQYGVERSLIRLEVTETAYTEKGGRFAGIIRQLREAGFFVEMDDFGSGYSSLTMLKEIPVDLLKLDLKFLASGDGLILNCAVQMAHWLDLHVIAEGVETSTQAEFLKTVGCRYVQGYYFSRPLSEIDFIEKLADKNLAVEIEQTLLLRDYSMKEIWDPDSPAAAVFNVLAGAAGIFEYMNGRFIPLRLNERFYQVTGISHEEIEHCRDLLEQVHPDDRQKLFDELDRIAGAENGAETEVKIRWYPSVSQRKTMWLRLRPRKIATQIRCAMIYCSVEDVTKDVIHKNSTAACCRLLVQELDVHLWNYDPESDVLRMMHRSEDGGVVTDVTERFLETIEDNTAIVRQDRLRLKSALEMALSGVGETTLEYQGARFGGYGPCRLAISVVSNGAGSLRCMTGIVTRVTKGSLVPESGALMPGEGENLLTLLGHLCDTSREYTCLLDTDTLDVVFCNPALHEHCAALCQNESCGEIQSGDGCLARRLCDEGTACLLSKEEADDWEMEKHAFSVGKRRFMLILARKKRSLEEETAREKLRMRMEENTVPYGEVVLLDYQNDRLQILADHRGGGHERTAVSLSRSLPEWIDRHVVLEDRRAVTEFFKESHLSALSASGEAMLTEMRLRVGERMCVCFSALTRINEGLFVCRSYDVTGLRKERSRLQRLALHNAQNEMEGRYRAVLRRIGAVVLEWVPSTHSFASSAAYRDFYASRFDPFEVFETGSEARRTFVHEKSLAAFEEMLDRLETENFAQAVCRIRMNDGSYAHMYVILSRDYVEDGEAHIFGVFLDVDNEKRSSRGMERVVSVSEGIIDNIPAGIMIYVVRGDDFCPFYLSRTGREMFGYTREEYDRAIARGETVGLALDRSVLTEEERCALREGKRVELPRVLTKRKNGEEMSLRVILTQREDPLQTSSPLCYATLMDVTQSIAHENRTRWREERYRLLSETSRARTFDYDPGEDVMTLSLPVGNSDRTERILYGYRAAGTGAGILPEEWQDFARQLDLLCAGEQVLSYDCTANYGDGLRRYRLHCVSVADHETGRILRVVGSINDIQDLYAQQQALEKRAEIDGTTGILNKAALREAIEEKMRQSGRADALFLIDIDNFKQVNDTLGHITGDHALHMVAMLIRSMVRQEDIVGRFGGDEFVVYLCGVPDRETLLRKAQLLVDAVSALRLEGKLSLRCSIGVAPYAERRLTFEALVNEADRALYAAKEHGKNRCVLFDPASGEHIFSSH